MLILLALFAQAGPTAASCQYDKAAMLALDLDRFDQDMTGGWRAVANAGCDRAAADLIAQWRGAHSAQPAQHYMLSWHEGQLRANAGQNAQAVALFERSRKTPAKDAGFGWNLYIDGSIAFLRRDRAMLKAARDRLAALPKPAGFAPVGPDGKPRLVRWPLNLNVLDGFLACWDRPYKQAYACAAPLFKVNASR